MTTTERPFVDPRGLPVTPPKAKGRALKTMPVPYTLTQRELDVLYLLREGLNEVQIAASLHLAESAIRGYVGSILVKMNARSKTEAAVKAIREGIFGLD